MHTRKPASSPFKRQVVVRIAADDWPLLEAAAQEHGSIQAALLAGLHALNQPPRQHVEPEPNARETTEATAATEASPSAPVHRDEEITAREAANLLELKPGTVRGYIRAGRLTGHYRDTPGSSGWITTRGSVEDYRRQVQGKR